MEALAEVESAGDARRVTDDTIFAPASGAGRAGICVVRISGPGTRPALDQLAGGPPPPRRLSLRALRDHQTGEVLDRALVAWFPAPGSYTGEDGAELHIHGGLAVRAAVLGALGSLPFCRPAEPGEFTRRAFRNGRMDLSQVEGLADLIDAETEAQRRQAQAQLDGALGGRVESWRDRLIEALALLEAALDFSDEGDVPQGLEDRAWAAIDGMEAEIARALDDERRGERLRHGFVVVIAGPPNAGKSTLLNALARREVAIVSPVPGTTRDAIEVRCDLDGLPVTFVDTAGLRDTDDPVEQEGVARARARAAAADLVLRLVPPGRSQGGPGGPGLVVATKADLGGPPSSDADLAVSARTGEGLDRLLARIAGQAEAAIGLGDAVVTRERHRRALERTREALGRAEAALGRDEAELGAEDVRLALRSLGEVTGRVDVEHILDRLFGSFCIGK
jgi:tRNA modification GTPase